MNAVRSTCDVARRIKRKFPEEQSRHVGRDPDFSFLLLGLVWLRLGKILACSNPQKYCLNIRIMNTSVYSQGRKYVFSRK